VLEKNLCPSDQRRICVLRICPSDLSFGAGSAYLARGELSAGEIAQRFDISKPSVSKHLSILENAGLVASRRDRQFIFYSLVEENVVNTLNGFVQEVCPVARPLKRERKKAVAVKVG
jgi:ArsR family transcriptional regulator